jgi:glucose/arabinose dehydrogenase
LRNDFTPLAQNVSISVDQASEQGLLNVAADPDYNNNKFIYFYFTVPGSSPDINQVDRFTVTVDKNAGTFSLGDRVMIIQFNKNQSPQPGNNHNGGSMVFNLQQHLLIGVGDGGGSGSENQTFQISQDPSLTLGKLHRIIPSRQVGVGGFTVPAGQPFTIQFEGMGVIAADSVFSTGVRNPFTMVMEDDGDIFFGDVGSGSFEEINCAYLVDAPENYGWPFCEGPCTPPVPGFVNPIHSYAHGDDTFDDEDPEDNPQGGQSIMVNAFYNGDAYGPDFKGTHGKIIYSEFFEGWVRLATLNAFDQVTATQHIGHVGGLTGLHENPADGLLYGTSLFGSDRIVRMDLTP